MTETPILPKRDAEMRLAIYRFTIQRGHVPKASELARTLSWSERAVRGAFQRLADAHILVLQQESPEILRLAPFWAVPTRFQVESGKRVWWASCVWDALGIPAMLHRDARITTACGCCDSAMTLEVRRGNLVPERGVIHFAVPALRWYDNVLFT
jgi:hypothetical protein